MSKSDESALGVFKRKVLRKIYGLLRIGNGEYRTRWNDELYELCGNIDIVQRIRKQRLASSCDPNGKFKSFRCNTRVCMKRRRKTSTFLERPYREGPGCLWYFQLTPNSKKKKRTA
ncbi:unnamed protein product [Ceratitis capitata]|uniref:(Mediterranean fruit fly) hypothetical protein n=1 Tax=Ceratitis capitata TaxID=7213 RepID=A0A811U850_CERCA|nr:unnamed protein product [Ceratitis capitata]